MIHRHLDYPPGTPPEQLGPAAIDDLLDRGDLKDWAPLARAVAKDPWGPLAETILRICDAHVMYGTSPLWKAFVATLRAEALGHAGAAWPTRSPRSSLAQLRTARGLNQAEIGRELGMNQSEVSRLERRRDLRLSTLRAFVEAMGGRLRIVVTRPDGGRPVEVVVGDPDAADQPAGQSAVTP